MNPIIAHILKAIVIAALASALEAARNPQDKPKY
jgi:hypothetical protein